MKRYSIMVVERDSGREVELAQVDTNPSAVAQAALAMKLGRGRNRVDKYQSVRIHDNETGKPLGHR